MQKTSLIIISSQDFGIFIRYQKSEVPALLDNSSFIHAILFNFIIIVATVSCLCSYSYVTVTFLKP